MNKELREALAENLTYQPWRIAVDAALRWGMECNDDNLEEAYTVGRIWNLLRMWRGEVKQFERTTYRYTVADQMKYMGWPVFDNYQDSARFVLIAVYGDDDA